MTPPRRARRRIAGLVIPGIHVNQKLKVNCPSPPTLDVVTKNLAVALGSTLSESLSTLSAARHVYLRVGGGGGEMSGVVGGGGSQCGVAGVILFNLSFESRRQFTCQMN